jgi:hypothetical protein
LYARWYSDRRKMSGQKLRLYFSDWRRKNENYIRRQVTRLQKWLGNGEKKVLLSPLI